MCGGVRGVLMIDERFGGQSGGILGGLGNGICCCCFFSLSFSSETERWVGVSGAVDSMSWSNGQSWCFLKKSICRRSM